MSGHDPCEYFSITHEGRERVTDFVTAHRFCDRIARKSRERVTDFVTAHRLSERFGHEGRERLTTLVSRVSYFREG